MGYGEPIRFYDASSGAFRRELKIAGEVREVDVRQSETPHRLA